MTMPVASVASGFVINIAKRSVDENNQCVFLEKVKIGDSHSCINLVPVVMNEVLIPAGSLFSTMENAVRDEAAHSRPGHKHKGFIIPLAAYEGFRFLRITTLALDPALRKRAFGALYNWQSSHNFVGFDSIKLSDLAEIARQQC